MRYLLDTCTLIWFSEDSVKLSPLAREIITESSNDILVSVISLWEISIKSLSGKLMITYTPEELAARCVKSDMGILTIDVHHVQQFHRLPTTHRDPFDRILAATAISEGCHFISPDIQFDILGANRFW